MENKKVLYKLKSFLKQNWLFLFLYAFVFVIIIIGVNSYVTSEINHSEESIKRKIRPYDDSYYNYKDSYSIVSYELRDKPSMVDEDASLYEQMYGNANYYYAATNQPWAITKYQKGSIFHSYINAYRLQPCAVALKYKSENSPVKEFRQLYDLVVKNHDVKKQEITPLEDIKTDFHYIEKISLSDEVQYHFTDTLWYTDNSNNLFLTETRFAQYYICNDNEKESLYRYCGVAALVVIETIIFALIWYFRRRIKKIKLGRFKNPLTKEPPTIDNSFSDADYEVLLHKINPINFMNPYDAEKVKIANDLYSALLKSKDNETIIKMIEEKAKKDLKI